MENDECTRVLRARCRGDGSNKEKTLRDTLQPTKSDCDFCIASSRLTIEIIWVPSETALVL